MEQGKLGLEAWSSQETLLLCGRGGTKNLPTEGLELNDRWAK